MAFKLYPILVYSILFAVIKHTVKTEIIKNSDIKEHNLSWKQHSRLQGDHEDTGYWNKSHFPERSNSADHVQYPTTSSDVSQRKTEDRNEKLEKASGDQLLQGTKRPHVSTTSEHWDSGKIKEVDHTNIIAPKHKTSKRRRYDRSTRFRRSPPNFRKPKTKTLDPGDFLNQYMEEDVWESKSVKKDGTDLLRYMNLEPKLTYTPELDDTRTYGDGNGDFNFGNHLKDQENLNKQIPVMEDAGGHYVSPYRGEREENFRIQLPIPPAFPTDPNTLLNIHPFEQEPLPYRRFTTDAGDFTSGFPEQADNSFVPSTLAPRRERRSGRYTYRSLPVNRLSSYKNNVKKRNTEWENGEEFKPRTRSRRFNKPELNKPNINIANSLKRWRSVTRSRPRLPNNAKEAMSSERKKELLTEKQSNGPTPKKSFPEKKRTIFFNPNKIVKKFDRVGGSNLKVDVSISKVESDGMTPGKLACMVETTGVLNADENTVGESKGHTYSQAKNDEKKSIICKSQTSEVVKPNENVRIVNSVAGSTFITTDYDKIKQFLDGSLTPKREELEIGTSSHGNLTSDSKQNQTVSLIESHDKMADSKSLTSLNIDQEGDKRVINADTLVKGHTMVHGTGKYKPIGIKNVEKVSVVQVRDPETLKDKDWAGVASGKDVQTFTNTRKETEFEIELRRLNFANRRSNLNLRKKDGSE